MKYKVTLVGSRRTGKTALAHFAVNTGARTTYDATTEANSNAPIVFQLEHPDLGKCLVDIEDTPGFKPDPHSQSEDPIPPKELLEPQVAYMFCDDGVRKPRGEKPEEEDEEDEGEEGGAPKGTEKEKLVPSQQMELVSDLDLKQDRQGFIVVYSEIDRDSFGEAKKLLTDIQTRMSKPAEEGSEAEDPSEPDPDEELPEIPPMPVVLVATHSDAKKTKKTRADKFVSKDEGCGLADEFNIPFFQTNSQRGGKHVKDTFVALISAIQKVEDNLVWDKGPTCCERFCDRCCCDWCKCFLNCSCKRCCSCFTCGCCQGPITCCGHVCCVDGCSIM